MERLQSHYNLRRLSSLKACLRNKPSKKNTKTENCNHSTEHLNERKVKEVNLEIKSILYRFRNVISNHTCGFKLLNAKNVQNLIKQINLVKDIESEKRDAHILQSCEDILFKLRSILKELTNNAMEIRTNMNISCTNNSNHCVTNMNMKSWNENLKKVQQQDNTIKKMNESNKFARALQVTNKTSNNISNKIDFKSDTKLNAVKNKQSIEISQNADSFGSIHLNQTKKFATENMNALNMEFITEELSKTNASFDDDEQETQLTEEDKKRLYALEHQHCHVENNSAFRSNSNHTAGQQSEQESYDIVYNSQNQVNVMSTHGQKNHNIVQGLHYVQNKESLSIKRTYAGALRPQKTYNIPIKVAQEHHFNKQFNVANNKDFASVNESQNADTNINSNVQTEDINRNLRKGMTPELLQKNIHATSTDLELPNIKSNINTTKCNDANSTNIRNNLLHKSSSISLSTNSQCSMHTNQNPKKINLLNGISINENEQEYLCKIFDIPEENFKIYIEKRNCNKTYCDNKHLNIIRNIEKELNEGFKDSEEKLNLENCGVRFDNEYIKENHDIIQNLWAMYNSTSQGMNDIDYSDTFEDIYQNVDCEDNKQSHNDDSFVSNDIISTNEDTFSLQYSNPEKFNLEIPNYFSSKGTESFESNIFEKIFSNNEYENSILG